MLRLNYFYSLNQVVSQVFILKLKHSLCCSFFEMQFLQVNKAKNISKNVLEINLKIGTIYPPSKQKIYGQNV